jgi:hypothetical protein
MIPQHRAGSVAYRRSSEGTADDGPPFPSIRSVRRGRLDWVERCVNVFVLVTGLVIMLGLAAACAALHEPWAVSLPQAGVTPRSRLDAIDDHRTAVATIGSIFERDLGFPPFPVTFLFYPHREAFERALLASGYDAALARSTARTMTAVGGHGRVLLNDAALDSMSWTGRVALLAHELGHSLQYELGGGRRGTSDQWLREGFAEWLSIRVLERLGAISMKAYHRDRQAELRAAGPAKAVRLADMVTFPEWVALGERSGAIAYAQAFLAVDFLLERHGVPAVLQYFERFATSSDRAGNFRAAFGEDLDSFEASLMTRLWRK